MPKQLQIGDGSGNAWTPCSVCRTMTSIWTPGGTGNVRCHRHPRPLHRRTVLSMLQHGLAKRDFRSRGERAFMTYFLEWFQNHPVRTRTRLARKTAAAMDYRGRLPSLIERAWADMLKDPLARARYLDEFDGDDRHCYLGDLRKVGNLQRALTVQTTGHAFRAVLLDDGIAGVIDRHFRVEDRKLDGSFRKFVREVYWKGLFETIQASARSGMSGRFGETDLMSFVTAGRLMFTFQRGVHGSDDYASISYVMEEGKRTAHRGGLQSMYCDLPTAISMMDEVIRHWPSPFEDNKNVGLG